MAGTAMSGARAHRALLVGNTRMQEDPEHLGPLTAPPNDAARLRDALTDGVRGLHRAEDVSVHVDETRDKVLQAIEGFFWSARPGDELLLYYSGHGIADDHHHLYLCASDTMAQFPFSTAIPAGAIARMIDDSAAAAVVVLLDCRYSATFQKRGDAAEPPAARLAGPRRYVLANGQDGPGSDGPAVRPTSALTEAVVAGLLAGWEADWGREVPLSLDGLWSFVVDRLGAAGEPAPRRWFDGAGDLLVARAPVPSPARPPAGDLAAGAGPVLFEPPAGWDGHPEDGDGEPRAAPGPDAATAPDLGMATAAPFHAPGQPQARPDGGDPADQADPDSTHHDRPDGGDPADPDSTYHDRPGSGEPAEPAESADPGEPGEPGDTLAALGDQSGSGDPADPDGTLGDLQGHEEPAALASVFDDLPDGGEPADPEAGVAGRPDSEGPEGVADTLPADAPAGQERWSAAPRRPQRKSWMDTMLTAAQRREVMGWELEFEYVRQESPHAAALLQLSTFLDARGIPVGLLAGAADVLPPELADVTLEHRELNAAVAILEEHGLIARSGDMLTVPRLVQFAVRSNLGPEHGQEWSGRALCLVAQAFSPPGGNAPQPAWAHPTRLLVHAEAAAGHAQALGVPIEELPSVLDAIGTHLWSMGKPRSARIWFARALETSRQLYGPVDRHVANAMEKLAAIHRELGDVVRGDRLQHDAMVMSSALDRSLVRPREYPDQADPGRGQP
ncbi:MAG TPA: caspase family protein [Actinomycetes bacterium]|nr:caspase family protein [Actinomycetes bacterium]